MRLTLPPHIEPAHPIATQEYAVYTPPISDLTETIGNWINRMESGGYIYGASRLGKSRGVKWYVRAAMEERFKHSVPLVIWIRRHDMHVSETDFWKDLLLASGFHFSDPAKRGGSRSQLRELFRFRMISFAKSSASNHAVLLIDEAQEMTLREWIWLLGLQNVLDDDGYRLSVISVGTQQIGYQHDFLTKSGNAHIAARFFVLHSRFHGLRCKEELKFVLEGYDQESEWPEKSGKSYMHYFAPKDFLAGRRLANCVDVIWDAFIDLIPNSSIDAFKRRKSEVEIPMKNVALAIEEVLWKLAEGEEWENVTTYESWSTIISETGFSSHMKAITSE